MSSRVLFTVLVTALLLAMASPILAAPAAQEVDEALNWLKEQQNADGGFSDGFSPDSGVAPTAEAVIALAAGGQDPGTVRSTDDKSPLDYLDEQVRAGQVEGPGTTAKVVMAVVAAGLDPAGFGGHDLLGGLEAAYDADTGSYRGSIFDQALIMLALANAGRSVPEAAAEYLMTYQTADGAWSFTGDTAAETGDTNTTALAIQALVAAGRQEDTEAALAYLQQVQNPDGGWPYQNPSQYGTETDANSTALALEAIDAVGQTPEDWSVDGADPLGALLSLQNDNGSFNYQASMPGDNILATIQAIPAAAGMTLAQIQRVPTTAAPGTTSESPSATSGSGATETGENAAPGTLPAAGGVTRPVALGVLFAGIALFTVGWMLRRAHTSLPPRHE